MMIKKGQTDSNNIQKTGASNKKVDYRKNNQISDYMVIYEYKIDQATKKFVFPDMFQQDI